MSPTLGRSGSSALTAGRSLYGGARNAESWLLHINALPVALKDLRVVVMGKVVLVVRVNPQSDEVNLDELVDKIKHTLPSQYDVMKVEKFYIAFGLHGLRIYITMPEEYEGGTYELENLLSNVDGVGSVDVEYITRLFTD